MSRAQSRIGQTLTYAEAQRVEVRFRARHEQLDEADCWSWTGARNSKYGVVSVTVNGDCRRYYAHRVAWVLASGEDLPSGLTLDHLCRNTLCVNPGHLDVVTLGENARRAGEIRERYAREHLCRHCGRAFSRSGYYRHLQMARPEAAC